MPRRMSRTLPAPKKPPAPPPAVPADTKRDELEEMQRMNPDEHQSDK